MATTRLPQDFREFLQSLNSHGVEYLLVGGYAVNYYGYIRATGDMDIWVNPTLENAARVVQALVAFGFEAAEVSVDLFLQPDTVVQMGVPPFRIELLTQPSGVVFAACWSQRKVDIVDGVEIPIIGLDDLKRNKAAAARHKDLDDLEHLS